MNASGTIQKLEGLFVKAGREAFADAVRWSLRAKRIARLVKSMSRDGDVYVVCRRMMQPDEFVLVAKQRES